MKITYSRPSIIALLIAITAACSSIVEHRENSAQIGVSSQQNQPPDNHGPEVTLKEIEVAEADSLDAASAPKPELHPAAGNLAVMGSHARHSSPRSAAIGAVDGVSQRSQRRVKAQRLSMPVSPPPTSREGYQHHEESDFQDPLQSPHSTFSTDVDTASYANTRRFLQSGTLPIPSSIRIEEFLNYFEYSPIAKEEGHPVAVGTSWAPCPWNPENLLLQVRVETQSVNHEELPPLNLVYLIDTSGSMHSQLGLLVDGLSMLTRNLRPIDRVAIVTYAGSSGIVLQPTSGYYRTQILQALNNLRSGGTTAGAQGIKTAYALARENFQKDAINRVILATDGDFNVGISDQGSLVRLIEKERESGVFLSVLGFGRGNYQDHRLESIADHGNGQYSYIDSALEAHRVLVKRAGGTLNTVAKDVKLRVEFNPSHVGEYRLIGYDNRRLTTKEFDDDKKDAGDVGAGHMVTALYEIKPRAKLSTDGVTPLRYQGSRPLDMSHNQEWLTAELRYKLPQTSTSKLMTYRSTGPKLGEALSSDWALLSSLAEFGLLLKDSRFKGRASYTNVLRLAQEAAFGSSDPARQEYVSLVARAAQLSELHSSFGTAHQNGYTKHHE